MGGGLALAAASKMDVFRTILFIGGRSGPALASLVAEPPDRTEAAMLTGGIHVTRTQLKVGCAEDSLSQNGDGNSRLL